MLIRCINNLSIKKQGIRYDLTDAQESSAYILSNFRWNRKMKSKNCEWFYYISQICSAKEKCSKVMIQCDLKIYHNEFHN